MFVLRMVSSHAGVIFGSDLVLALWNSFYVIEEKVHIVQYYIVSISENDDRILAC